MSIVQCGVGCGCTGNFCLYNKFGMEEGNMPVINVKSPEIAQMDQEAERQRQHQEWLDQIAPPLDGRVERWGDVAIVTGVILGGLLILRGLSYMILGL